MNNSSDAEDVVDNINVDEILHSIESDKLLSVSKLTYDKINTIKYVKCKAKCVNVTL